MSYPIPLLTEILGSVSESLPVYYSSVDCHNGYWQCAMSPEASEKATFVTHRGAFRPKRLATGLCNAGTTFQMMMNKVLQGMNWSNAVPYLDDILIWSTDFGSHKQDLARLFQALEKHNIKSKASKYKFDRYI